MYQNICHSHQENASHEQGAHPAGHADRIEQGAADGFVPAMGHHSQQEILTICKDTEDQELDSNSHRKGNRSWNLGK